MTTVGIVRLGLLGHAVVVTALDAAARRRSQA
jgi:hypothetical protein